MTEVKQKILKDISFSNSQKTKILYGDLDL